MSVTIFIIVFIKKMENITYMKYKIFVYLFVVCLLGVAVSPLSSSSRPSAPVLPPPNSGGHYPPTNLSISISTDKFELYRGEIIEVSYSIKGGNNSIYDIKGKIKIPSYFDDITDVSMQRGYKTDKRCYKIIFNGDLGKNKYANCSYKARISSDAPLGVCFLNDTIDKSTWRWSRKKNLNVEGNYTLHIKNVKPKVQSSSVTIPTTIPFSCKSSQNMLICTDSDKPLKLNLDVSATDEDCDYENLTYSWRIASSTEKSTGIFYNTTLCESTYTLKIMIPEKCYIFYVSANDSINQSDELQTDILYGDTNYTGIYILSSRTAIPIVVYAIILILLLLIGWTKDQIFKSEWWQYIENKCRTNGKSYIYEIILAAAVIAITMLYVVLYYFDYVHELFLSDYFDFTPDWILLYLKSLQFFGIYVYVVIFMLVVYFAEVCFGQRKEHDPNKLNMATSEEHDPNKLNMATSKEHDSDKLNMAISEEHDTNKLNMAISEDHDSNKLNMAISEDHDPNKLNMATVLWFSSTIIMLILLLSFNKIISHIELSPTQTWLQTYYGELGEIFATILAIVAAFYTATSHEYDPDLLRNFVALYGIIVILSIWGFSAGTLVEFNTMVDITNLFNLFSIAVFETTLLLVPVAIVC